MLLNGNLQTLPQGAKGPVADIIQQLLGTGTGGSSQPGSNAGYLDPGQIAKLRNDPRIRFTYTPEIQQAVTQFQSDQKLPDTSGLINARTLQALQVPNLTSRTNDFLNAQYQHNPALARYLSNPDQYAQDQQFSTQHPDTYVGPALPEVTAIQQQVQDAQHRATVAATASLTDAERTADLHKMWPTLTPEVVTAFSQDGKTAADPIVASAALMSTQSMATNRLANDQSDWLAQQYANGVKSPDVSQSPVWQNHVNTAKQESQAALNPPKPTTNDSGGGGFLDDVWGGVRTAAREGFLGLAAPLQTLGGLWRMGTAGFSEMAGAQPGVQYADPTLVSPSHPELMQQQPSQNVGGFAGASSFGDALLKSSSLGIQASNAVSGSGPTDVGNGILPSGDSPVAQAQASFARQQLSVNGSALTPGRAFGYALTDPNATAYNVLSGVVDGAVALALDPAAKVLKLAGEANTARKTFSLVSDAANEERTGAGLFQGIKKVVQPQQFSDWIAGRGQKVTQFLADNTDFETARKMVGGDARLAAALTPHDSVISGAGELLSHTPLEQTPEQVSEILRSVAGADLKQVPRIPMSGYGGSKFTSIPANLVSHMFAQMPRSSWSSDLDNIDGIVEQGVNMMKNAHVDSSIVNEQAYHLASVTTPDELLRAKEGVELEIARQLDLHGNTADITQKYTRLVQNNYSALRHYATDGFGHDTVPDFLMVDGKTPKVATDVLEDLSAATPVFMEDTRKVRALTGAFAPLYQHPIYGAAAGAAAGAVAGALLNGENGAMVGATIGGGYGMRPFQVNAVLNQFTTQIFKPLALATRIAFPIRTIGEQQASMAANGYTSLFNDLNDHIAWTLANKGSLTTEDFAKFADDQYAMGKVDAYTQGMISNRGPNNVLDLGSDAKVFLSKRINYSRDLDREQFINAWANELAKRANSPVARTVAENYADPQAAKDWFSSGAGQGFKDQLMARGNGWERMADPTHADAYIDWYHDKVLGPLSGEHPDIVEALKTGKLRIPGPNGEEDSLSPLLTRGNVKQGFTVPVEVKNRLSELADQGVGPEIVPGPLVLRDQKAGSIGSIWERLTQQMFHSLMSAPTDKLNNSPLFRQAYWHRVVQLVEGADPDTIEQFASQAEKALVNSRGQVTSTGQRIVDAIRDGGGLAGRKLYDPNEANDIASQADEINAIAGQQVAHFRGLHFPDVPEGAHRLPLPNALATPEGVTPAALTLDQIDTLAKSHALDVAHTVLHDLSSRTQVMDVMRNIAPFGDAWKLMIQRWTKTLATNPQGVRRIQQGFDGARGAGFFYKNANGEEVFNYPLSSQLTSSLIGVPIPLAGRVSGLNMVGSILPGVGPVMQIPAHFLLPATPTADSLKRFIFPQGDSLGGGLVNPVINSVAPSWFNKLEEAAGDPSWSRQFNNTVMQIDAYLASTGKYQTDASGVRQRLMDARDKATKFMVLRVAASNALPSAPIPTFQIQDRSGRLQSIDALKDDLRKFQDTDYNTSAQKFIDKWGENAYSLMQPLTQSVAGALPVTKKQGEWVSAHSDVVSKYPYVYGYFAPLDPNGQFDQPTYQNQLNSGARVSIDPATWQRLVNDRLGRTLYDKEKAWALAQDGVTSTSQLSSENAQYLKDYKVYLVNQYEGYNSNIGKVNRASDADMIHQLQSAVDDPSLRSSQVAVATRLYLKEREWVIANAPNRGWQTATASEEYRQYLSDYQDYLLKKYKSAAPLFQSVFRNDIQHLSS